MTQIVMNLMFVSLAINLILYCSYYVNIILKFDVIFPFDLLLIRDILNRDASSYIVMKAYACCFWSLIKFLFPIYGREDLII